MAAFSTARHAGQHRRDGGEARHAPALDELERALGVEVLHHDDVVVVAQRAVRDEEAVRVVQRRRDQLWEVLGEVHVRARHRLLRALDVLARERRHDHLGPAGRPARGDGGGRLGDHVGQRLGRAIRAGVHLVEGHDRHRAVVVVADEQGRAGDVEEALALPGREVGPDRQHPGADLPGADRDEEVLGRVDQPDRDPVAGAGAPLGEEPSDLGRAGVELAPGDLAVVGPDGREDDRGGVGMHGRQVRDPPPVGDRLRRGRVHGGIGAGHDGLVDGGTSCAVKNWRAAPITWAAMLFWPSGVGWNGAWLWKLNGS